MATDTIQAEFKMITSKLGAEEETCKKRALELVCREAKAKLHGSSLYAPFFAQELISFSWIFKMCIKHSGLLC